MKMFIDMVNGEYYFLDETTEEGKIKYQEYSESKQYMEYFEYGI